MKLKSGVRPFFLKMRLQQGSLANRSHEIYEATGSNEDLEIAQKHLASKHWATSRIIPADIENGRYEPLLAIPKDGSLNKDVDIPKALAELGEIEYDSSINKKF